jgi:CHAT domain-containing protein
MTGKAPTGWLMRDQIDDALSSLEQQLFSDPPAAIASSATMLPEVDRHGSIAQRLGVRRLLAAALAHASQFNDSLRICEEAQSLPDAGSAPIELARVTLASMQALANLDRVDEAIVAGEEALQMFEEQGAPALAGRAALNIGAIYAMTGRPADALVHFDRAAVYLKDDPVLRGQIESNRGTALAALDRFDEAEDAFRRASDALSAAEMPWAQAIAEGNLADLASRQGDINRSLRHFENSRRYLERDEAWGDLGRLNAEEAAALAMTGLTDVAHDAFADAIAILREHGTPADLAMALIAYGSALADAGDLDEAENLLIETASLISADEHPSIYLQLLSLRAHFAIATGDSQEASTIITAAMPLVGDRPVQQLRWAVIRARLARECGEPDRAEEILRDALAGAAAARITPLVAVISASLAKIARDKGNDVAADAYARQSIAASERVRGTIQANRIRQSWHLGHLDIYGDLYRSTLRQPDIAHQAEGFDIAERIRSRTLLDAVRIRANDLEDIQPATDAERALIDERAAHRRWLNWMYSSLADGAEPDDNQLEELRNRERAVGHLEDRLAILRPPSPLGTPLALRAVQDILQDDHAIVAYLRVGESYSAQVITGDTAIGIADVAPARRVGSLVAQLQFQINRALARSDGQISPAREARLRRDTDAVLAQLHDVLFQPVLEHIGHAHRIIVIPSSDLYSIPFAALRDANGYLVDRYEFATAPGVSILANLRYDAVARTTLARNPLIAGVPDEVAPGLGHEARVVADRFPGATALLEEDATLEAVLSALPGADLVHLACHGRFDSVHPTASGLRLTDGWLTVDRLMEIRLGHPLVMLSGCETGRVRVDRGDDLVGIIVAMIASGARGLVTSLWKTHDRAATASMVSYYDGLMDGLDPVAALRRSQHDVRQAFPHPAFWAPFIGVHASRKGAAS